jgi:glycosyltransferase involved in cell wall biosynthesis
MPPLRIVLVMIEPPLPFGNAAARWFYVLLKGLVERGHEVTAFAACSKPADIDKARDLFPKPAYDLRLFTFPKRGGLKAKWETLIQPYSYMFGPDLRQELAAELDRGFDILHLEQLWCGWLGLGHVDRTLINVHHLVGIDLEEFRPRTMRERIEQLLTFGAERRLIRAFRFFRSCSPRLVEPMKALNPRAEIGVVPVGLDSSLYEYIPDEHRSGEPILTLIGSMDWYPGRSAAIRLLDRLWPEIKRRVPEARLRIVGWSARSMLSNYLNLPDVTIEENVPDVRPYFEQTGVFLYAPSRGSGMKIKILEAMAFGVPVVTTSEGVEGLPVEDGVHAGVCEDDAGLIERAVALLPDRDRQNRQRRQARELIETYCGPAATIDGIESLYQKMLPQPAMATTR